MGEKRLSILIKFVVDRPWAILAVARAFSQLLWQTPFSIRVDSISNFQHSFATGDELIVSNLVPDEGETPGTAKEVRDIAMKEPLLLNRATNHAGNVVTGS